jgi:putative Ig domain-containing protein
MTSNLHRIKIASLIAIFANAMGGCTSGTLDSGPASLPPSATSNNAPVISGTPAPTALMNETYAFTPTASDPDNDVLTFSVQNQPRWAQFDSATGALTGTPGPGDVGLYANIVLSVSDGDLLNSLPEFSVGVVQIANGSLALTWTAPFQNEDGSVLLDLAAFKYYYGTSPGIYSDQGVVDNPGITTIIIDNLPPATYYIVATAINNAGVESRFSNETSKQVR